MRATWNVDDALAILMRGVDLVISDFDLGDLTALDLISHSEQWRSGTPIVVMVSREGQRERALQAGAAAVLRKPLDLIEFRTAVDNLF